MADKVLTIPMGETFEYGITLIRRGLTDVPRRATAASVRFELNGTPAGGPYPGVYDADVGGWVALCPPRTEAPGTELTRIRSATINGIVYESRGILRVTA